MEPLTHTLTGLMLSRVGFKQWCPRATAILLLAANAPDIDIVYRLGGSLDYLDHHRAITHGLAFIPVLAAAIVVGVRFVGRKPLPWIRALVTACVGLLSHLMWDWTNVYGIRMLLPFSGEWLRLDTVNVVDVWIWVVLIMAVAGPLLSRLVSSEIGAKPGSGKGAAIFALLVIACYCASRGVLHQRAVSTLDAHLYDGRPPKRVEAYPSFANPLSWNTVVDTGDAMIVQRISLLGDYDPMGGKVYYQAPASPALEAARKTDTMQRYLNFAKVVYWRTTPAAKPEGGVRVEACDLRFSDPSEPRFVATVILDPALRVVEESFSYGAMPPR